ncbi:hypothetical protein K474DRAFT_79636 [Panus rudis PR-1116 ss-1]|nr:hypothetical protein K474DRAFT_79636 [Panus rudis PR-1116 ss-1]
MPSASTPDFSFKDFQPSDLEDVIEYMNGALRRIERRPENHKLVQQTLEYIRVHILEHYNSYGDSYPDAADYTKTKLYQTNTNYAIYSLYTALAWIVSADCLGFHTDGPKMSLSKSTIDIAHRLGRMSDILHRDLHKQSGVFCPRPEKINVIRGVLEDGRAFEAVFFVDTFTWYYWQKFIVEGVNLIQCGVVLGESDNWTDTTLGKMWLPIGPVSTHCFGDHCYWKSLACFEFDVSRLCKVLKGVKLDDRRYEVLPTQDSYVVNVAEIIAGYNKPANGIPVIAGLLD